MSIRTAAGAAVSALTLALGVSSTPATAAPTTVGASTSPDLTTVKTAMAPTQLVRLLDGSRVAVTGEHIPRITAQSSSPAKAPKLVAFTLAGKHYAVPTSLMSVFGTTLDKSLFDVDALGAAGDAAKVSISYASSSSATAVPGVQIDARNGTSATGHLDAAGAAALASALQRSTASSIFAGVTRIALASAPGVATPTFPMHTVTLRVIGRDGKPGFGLLIAASTDNPPRYTGAAGVEPGVTSKLSMPSGHYLLTGFVDGNDGVSIPLVLDQVVTGPTTVTIDARTATTTPKFTTDRPTSGGLIDVAFGVETESQGLGLEAMAEAPSKVWITPTQGTTLPARMTLSFSANALLPSSDVTSYQYALAYGVTGHIPRVASFSANRNTVQTTRAQYLGPNLAGRPNVLNSGIETDLGGVGLIVPVSTPVTRTEYTGSNRPAYHSGELWIGYDDRTEIPLRAVRGYTKVHPGTATSEVWNRAPYHPTPLIDQSFGGDALCSSCFLQGDLMLLIPAHGDNDPRHWGLAVNDKDISWSVTSKGITQRGNSVLVTYLPAAKLGPDVSISEREVTLAPQGGTSVSTTTWKTPTSNRATTDPAKCFDLPGKCQELRLITANYFLPIDGFGKLPAGKVTGTLLVRTTGNGNTVTAVAAEVKLGSGAWQSIPTTKTAAGTYQVGFTASGGGAQGQLRITAKDAAGGSFTQTITNAFVVTSGK